MKLQVLMFYQDDPKKCTAAKMVKFGLAQNIKKIGSKGLVLDPFSEKYLLQGDKNSVSSIVGIACSARFHEQSIPTIELIEDLSLGNKIFSEKGSKTNPFEPIFLTF